MNKLKVLIVDDSPIVCELLRSIIENDTSLTVIGEAENGREACIMTARLRPDIITMDINMPVMDGLHAIEEIMAENPTPILVLTSSKDAATAYHAIMKGAVDVSEKPTLDSASIKIFHRKLHTIAALKVIRHMRSNKTRVSAELNPQTKTIGYPELFPIIGIASSTGGPKALVEIFKRLPAHFPAAIVVAQHIGNGFTDGLISWLNDVSPLKAQLAEEQQLIVPGTIYIPPDNHHIEVRNNRTLHTPHKMSGDVYTPSADRLFYSIGKLNGSGIGIVLSGMGRDGADGIISVKHSGGVTIAQDEESSVIYGMPKAAVETGCIDHILPLSGIADKLIKVTAERHRL
ncbi:MAG: chemotaxis-specific protein-glutamate methyltransferase CheB [Sphaerochaeta sp.]|nr:chemotaxis-specific protein-glutamate methyltransferase CheB [Sphaerochaeta sp.]